VRNLIPTCASSADRSLNVDSRPRGNHGLRILARVLLRLGSMKKHNKRLSLNKETLNSIALLKAAGGNTASCNGTCGVTACNVKACGNGMNNSNGNNNVCPSCNPTNAFWNCCFASFLA
jgi:hypothetical protein